MRTARLTSMRRRCKAFLRARWRPHPTTACPASVCGCHPEPCSVPSPVSRSGAWLVLRRLAILGAPLCVLAFAREDNMYGVRNGCCVRKPSPDRRTYVGAHESVGCSEVVRGSKQRMGECERHLSESVSRLWCAPQSLTACRPTIANNVHPSWVRGRREAR